VKESKNLGEKKKRAKKVFEPKILGSNILILTTNTLTTKIS
jgi:hypothetical protein